ncbi:hypothetical protein ACFLW8_02020 [Chloroflexota bacterium]
MPLKSRADGKGGLSARSVVYYYRILSKALDYAVKMGLVVRNVAKVVKPPRMARTTMQTLSPEEATRFLDAARETDYYVYFATLLYTIRQVKYYRKEESRSERDQKDIPALGVLPEVSIIN